MHIKLNTICCFILATLLAACNQNKTESSTSMSTADTSSLPVTMDDSSRIIIDRAIAYAGGNENWMKLKTISFDKESTSYDSMGKVTRVLNQHLDYMIRPVFRAKMTYTLNDTAITLIHDGEKARKYYNGQLSDKQKDIDGAWNACYGSQFVMCMPFKLKDPGIKAEFIGEVKLKGGATAQVVKTSYIKGAGSNHDHIWYYYFEPGSGKMLANSLNGKDNYWDYTEYTQMQNAGGLTWPALRTGYNADTINKPTILTGKSMINNVVVDKKFAADHFKIKDGK